VTDAVIVGGGIGGLATALLLGRQGRSVILCERDAAPVPSTTEEMWSGWERTGIPQWRLGHTFRSGFRTLLSERAPDVLERLLAAGAPLVDFSDEMPGDERRPEDADMSAIMCRRAVLEGILRQVVQAEATVELRPGCDVAGLVAEPSPMPGVPRVIGVRTRNGEVIRATSVVISGGRRVPLPRWLESIGASPLEEFAEGCGLVCYTRFFRIHLRPGEDHRVSTQLAVERETDSLKYEIFGADQSTFCVELAPPVWDREFRGLRHESTHMAVARALPEIEDWLDETRATPIGPVSAMGQEHNVLRRFVRDGRPLALGLHVIGDARCQLHSQYAWGSGIALASAVTLTDVLGEHPGDAEAQILDFEDRLAGEIEGRHRFSRARDRALQRAFRGEPEPAHADGSEDSIVHTVFPAAERIPRCSAPTCAGSCSSIPSARSQRTARCSSSRGHSHCSGRRRCESHLPRHARSCASSLPQLTPSIADDERRARPHVQERREHEAREQAPAR
jgi:2-polyprenyl-6-methoxyphenol hydroxylase-like FAD-dependent oxidoreductase